MTAVAERPAVSALGRGWQGQVGFALGDCARGGMHPGVQGRQHFLSGWCVG